jgi:CRP/FNR family transcriptional regulator, cyclic AMP receptor protein
VSTAPSLDQGDADRILMQLLGEAGILRHVEPEAASAMVKQLHTSGFAAGQTIFAQGDPGDRVYIIVTGKVKISLRGPGDRENLRAVMGPTDVFGELAVFDPGPRSCSATAITDVRAVWVDRATLRAWIAHRPVIAEQLLQALNQRLQHTEDQLIELISSDVATRVAHQLVLLARRFGTREGDALRLTHGLSQDEMAQLVAADRVSVNKALGDFASSGWITLQGKSVLITDADALARRAAAGAVLGVYRRRPLRATA